MSCQVKQLYFFLQAETCPSWPCKGICTSQILMRILKLFVETIRYPGLSTSSLIEPQMQSIRGRCLSRHVPGLSQCMGLPPPVGAFQKTLGLR